MSDETIDTGDSVMHGQAAVRKWLESLEQPIGHEQAQALIAEHVRQIEILCDQFGYDPNEWLVEPSKEKET